MKNFYFIIGVLVAALLLIGAITSSSEIYKPGEVLSAFDPPYPTLIEISEKSALGYEGIVIVLIPSGVDAIQGPFRLTETQGDILHTGTDYSDCEFYFSFTLNGEVQSRTYDNCLLLPNGDMVTKVVDIRIQKDESAWKQPERNFVTLGDLFISIFDTLLPKE
jgi:hypothetical protein